MNRSFEFKAEDLKNLFPELKEAGEFIINKIFSRLYHEYFISYLPGEPADNFQRLYRGRIINLRAVKGECGVVGIIADSQEFIDDLKHNLRGLNLKAVTRGIVKTPK